MATWYVRKSGSDSNNGNSPASAFLTIGHGLAATSAGDTVYVGAGTYRETILWPTEGSQASPVSLIGDTGGSRTGDKGYVILTGYLTGDQAAPSTTRTLDLGGKDGVTIQNLIVIGSNATGACLQTLGGTYVKCTRCVFISGSASKDDAVYVGVTGPAHHLFDSCIFFYEGTGHTVSNNFTLTTADYNSGVVFQNCKFWSLNNTGGIIGFTSDGSGAGKGGGTTFYNCTSFGAQYYVFDSGVSTTFPIAVYKCLIAAAGNGFHANVSGQLVEDNNWVYAVTPYTNVTAGVHSKSDGSYAPMLEIGQAELFGLTPLPFLMPMAGSPLLGFGTTQAGAPSADMLGITRPSPSSAGALEHDTFSSGTGTVHITDINAIASLG